MVKKIAVDGRYVDRQGTGISYYTQELLRVLSLCPDIDLTIIDTYQGAIDYSKKILTKYSRFNHTTSLFWYSFTLQNKLKKEGFDIFHSPAFNLPITDFIRKTVTIHDLTPFIVPHTMPLKFRFYLKYAIINAVRSSERILADSESVKNEILSLFGEKAWKKTTVWSPLYRDPCRIEKPQANGEEYILFVGQNNQRKNLGLLLSTFPSIKKLFPEISLKIAGVEPPDRKSPSGIEYLGYVNKEDKEDLYRKALVFVYPSLYEGFGIPVHEAFFYSVPVLASDIPVLRETGKDAVIYFDLNNEKDFQEKLIMIIKDGALRDELAKKGIKQLEQFKEDYSPEHLWKIFLQL